jgi:UDP-N-acetyl-D-mannosaminuronic acid dehydrogenase
MTSPYGFANASVIGLGYVGLPTAAVIASRGVPVTGVDINDEAVRIINSGASHIVEPDLDVVLGGVVAAGRLRAVNKPEPADVFIITVPTPITVDKKADMRAVAAAVRSIGPVLEKGNLVVLESTSPVGTTDEMVRVLAGMRPDLSFPHIAPERSDVMMAYCPERVLPGSTLRELIENPRIVGGLDVRSAKRAGELYRIFCRGEILSMGAAAAELTKLAENSYRDVNLAFANELSMLCDCWGLDVFEVIDAANHHPRVNILRPGPGVGGHCIPVDPWFIVDAMPEMSRLIRTAREVNHAKTEHVIARIRDSAGRFKSPVIAMLGLAYKPDVDDLRESPALEIVEHAAKHQFGELLVVEPYIDMLPPSLVPMRRVRLTPLDEALSRADVVAVLVAHKAFATVPPKLLAQKVIVDSVGIWRGHSPGLNHSAEERSSA